MEPIAISINDAARVLSLGRTPVYNLINTGRLETIKIGRRTLVLMVSIQKLVQPSE